jgi:hypothetical protein
MQREYCSEGINMRYQEFNWRTNRSPEPESEIQGQLDSAILCKAVLSTGWIATRGRGRDCRPGTAKQAKRVLITLWTQLFLESPQLAATVLLLEV